MGVQDWTYALVIYFFGVFVVLTLLSLGGAFADNSVTSTGGYTPQTLANQSQIEAPEGSTGILGAFSMKSYFKDLFSFFIFNISINEGDVLMSYLWLIRLIFVYMPLLFLTLSIYYSMPTVSG